MRQAAKSCRSANKSNTPRSSSCHVLLVLLLVTARYRRSSGTRRSCTAVTDYLAVTSCVIAIEYDQDQVYVRHHAAGLGKPICATSTSAACIQCFRLIRDYIAATRLLDSASLFPRCVESPCTVITSSFPMYKHACQRLLRRVALHA